MDLQNKVTLITGGSSGIGKETALLFAKHGATVILAARDLSKMEAVVKIIEKSKGKADCVIMDTSDREQVQRSIEKIILKYKHIDILVNNAGIARWGSIEDVSHEDFNEQVQVNLIGYFNPIKEVVPHMVARKSGCIINIISSTVKNTKAKRVAYAASKYGQAGLSNAVHEDLKEKGINVTALYPGKANTPIHDLAQNNPARKKMLDPKKVAELALYVARLPPTVKIKEVCIDPN